MSGIRSLIENIRSIRKEDKTTPPAFDRAAWMFTSDGNFEGAVIGDLDKASFITNDGKLKIDGTIVIEAAKIDGGQPATRTSFIPADKNFKPIIIEEMPNRRTR